MTRTVPTRSSPMRTTSRQHVGAMPAATVALAERAAIDVARGDWVEAERLINEALSVVADRHVSDYAAPRSCTPSLLGSDLHGRRHRDAPRNTLRSPLDCDRC